MKRHLHKRRLLGVLLGIFIVTMLPFIVGCILYKNYSSNWFVYWVGGASFIFVGLLVAFIATWTLESIIKGLVKLYNYLAPRENTDE